MRWWSIFWKLRKSTNYSPTTTHSFLFIGNNMPVYTWKYPTTNKQYQIIPLKWNMYFFVFNIFEKNYMDIVCGVFDKYQVICFFCISSAVFVSLSSSSCWLANSPFSFAIILLLFSYVFPFFSFPALSSEDFFLCKQPIIDVSSVQHILLLALGPTNPLFLTAWIGTKQLRPPVAEKQEPFSLQSGWRMARKLHCPDDEGMQVNQCWWDKNQWKIGLGRVNEMQIVQKMTRCTTW